MIYVIVILIVAFNLFPCYLFKQKKEVLTLARAITKSKTSEIVFPTSECLTFISS